MARNNVKFDIIKQVQVGPGEVERSYSYCLVNNIPENFHTSDLRNYFSSFIEAGRFDCFHFRHRPQFICNPSESKLSSLSQNNLEAETETPSQSKKSTCCVARFVSEEDRSQFIKIYHNKFWMDKDGNDVRERCYVSAIKINTNDIEKFAKELQPPRLMPKGNVGTRNIHFLNLIKECRLPPSLIKKLGLEFPTGRRYRKYCKVPFNYCTTVVKGSSEEIEVTTGRGHTISDTFVDKSEIVIDSKSENDGSGNNPDSDSDPDADDDRGEEWERHVTFEDDPTTQERIKERLYEEEIELVWEKGGPGIVWYTDAQFWDAQRGGFDEKTSDNLDVDVDGYFESGEGDKDARDYLEMRQAKCFQTGLDPVSVFKKPVDSPSTSKAQFERICIEPSEGSFDKYSKGVGMKVMKKYGWREGMGLGKTIAGMTDALHNEGQHPSDKRGIGYYGEAVEFKRQKKSHLREDYDDEHRVRIGTIYDNPSELDTPEPLLRSNSISYIKRYQK